MKNSQLCHPFKYSSPSPVRYFTPNRATFLHILDQFRKKREFQNAQRRQCADWLERSVWPSLRSRQNPSGNSKVPFICFLDVAHVYPRRRTMNSFFYTPCLSNLADAIYASPDPLLSLTRKADPHLEKRQIDEHWSTCLVERNQSRRYHPSYKPLLGALVTVKRLMPIKNKQNSIVWRTPNPVVPFVVLDIVVAFVRTIGSQTKGYQSCILLRRYGFQSSSSTIYLSCLRLLVGSELDLSVFAEHDRLCVASATQRWNAKCQTRCSGQKTKAKDARDKGRMQSNFTRGRRVTWPRLQLTIL